MGVLTTANSMMDLSEIRKQAQDEAWVTILHPVSGVETSMRIRLLSPDSERYRQIDNRIRNATTKSMTKRGGLSAEELSESGLQLLIQATVGWENVIFDGQPIQFSPENVRTVYTDFPFIREQVDRFLGDRRNFFLN